MQGDASKCSSKLMVVFGVLVEGLSEGAVGKEV